MACDLLECIQIIDAPNQVHYNAWLLVNGNVISALDEQGLRDDNQSGCQWWCDCG